MNESSRIAKWTLAGGLLVGTLDGLDAVIFFGMRGVAPGRIFQRIAGSLMGPSAFEGGTGTVALGIALHYGIATAIVLVYLLAARRFSALTRHAVVMGVLYGVAVFCVMNLVVVPNSAIPGTVPSGAGLVNGLAIHILGVGLPAALVARRALSTFGQKSDISV